MNPQPQQIDITSKAVTLEQLKALAYDQLAIREQAQLNLNALNAEIQKRQNEQPVRTLREDKFSVPTPDTGV